MKLNMHNVIASAILCTALLVSFCNAYPYPVYWDREAFLEQLQQEERVGTDVEARIEQVPDFLKLPGSCIFRCSSDFLVFVTNDDEKTIRRSTKPIGHEYGYECNSPLSITIDINGTTYDVIPYCFTQCPELSISNGVVEYHGIDNKLEPRDPDTTATYSCSGDYILEGEETRKCSRDDEWLGEAPKCILQCPELQDIPNGFVTFASRKPGATASYSCNSGYTLQGTRTRTCGQNGQWSDKEPSCIEVMCPELSRIPNGFVSFASRKPGATARYFCMEGYDLNGAKTRTCNSNGTWSDQEPTCEKECPNPSTLTVFDSTNANPSNVRVLRDFKTNKILGSEFDYECQSDFVLFVSKKGGAYIRASSNSITYECLRSTGSTFDPSISKNGRPKCFSLCPELSNISNGTVSYTSREPGATASYSCNSGYTLQGTRTRTCGQNGQWSDEEPSCIIEVMCPELSRIPNGFVNFTSRKPGAKANYSCMEGYNLNGTKTRTCNSNGTWSDQEPTCESIAVMCPELSDIPYGTVTFTNWRPGGIATYSCLGGYYLSGEQKRTCGQDGKWSCKEPTCLPLCPILSLPFGHIMYKFGNRKHGAIAAYSCRSGYRVKGPKERTCGQDGEWSGQEPTCIPLVLCPIPSLPNGHVTYGNRTLGDIANYSCSYGYRLNGTKNRTCGQDGEWSGKEPVCEAIICPLVNIPTKSSSPPIPLPGGGVGYPVGTVVTYTCRPYFELRGESTRTCLDSGEWDRPEPRCAGPLCPIPSLPNGRVNYGNRTLGDVAFYSCRYGYQLNGPENRTCRQNGTWSGEDPVCEAKPKCPKLKLSDIPKNVPEADRALKKHKNYQQLRYKQYYNRRIEGDRFEGSKAYLTCVNDWQLLKGTPAVQTCVRENGALVWTKAGTCVYYYTYPSYG